jgi:hypothetical protein
MEGLTMAEKQIAASFIPAIFTIVSAVGILTGCGDKKEDKPAPVVVHGTFTLSDSKGVTDNASVQLTSVDKCARDVNTGRVDLTLSAGVGQPNIMLAIKDYSASAKTYTCKQAADNRTSETDVGGKFETCMVDVKVKSSAEATSLNGYGIYRESATIDPFTYNGACTIDVTAATPSITAKINCVDMVQYLIRGGARRPNDGSITAKLVGELTCAFQ